MIFVVTLWLLLLQVLEAGQVKLTTQVELVSYDGTRVLAKLVKGLNCAG